MASPDLFLHFLPVSSCLVSGPSYSPLAANGVHASPSSAAAHPRTVAPQVSCVSFPAATPIAGHNKTYTISYPIRGTTFLVAPWRCIGVGWIAGAYELSSTEQKADADAEWDPCVTICSSYWGGSATAPDKAASHHHHQMALDSI